MSNNKFAFILGRERQLALAELKAVLMKKRVVFDIEKVLDNVAYLSIENFSQSEAKSVIDSTAGIVKIFCIISEHKTVKFIDLTQEIIELVEGRSQDKFGMKDIEEKPRVNFGISSYYHRLAKDDINRYGLDLKRHFKEYKISSRFVALTETLELSTIQTLKNKLDGEGVEIGIFSDCLGVLWALNDPEKWAKIDYDKPAADKYSGMLPPRLARMMVNIAVGSTDEFSTSLNNITIVDPFCGSGAILIEGLQSGYNVIGSDVSDKAVHDTKENMEWFLTENTNIKNQNLIFKADATGNNLIKMIKYKVGKNLIIVTEPFLGRPKKMKSTYEGTINEYRDIKDLYLDFFRNISEFNLPELKKTLCVIFPSVETKDGNRYQLYEICKAEIEKMGFIQNGEPFLYGRDYQIVKREIVVFKQIGLNYL